MNNEDLILRDLMESSDEIYDIPEMQDNKFDVEEYINSDYDFWFFRLMNREQLDQFKANYANLIVDGMDMETLEQFAVEMIEQNMSQWDEDDVKEEILDYYGEETLADLMPVLESQAPDYGVGKWWYNYSCSMQIKRCNMKKVFYLMFMN